MVTVLLGVLAAGGRAQAHVAGITSAEFPSLATGCNGCHKTPGAAVAPAVTLTASSLALAAGQQITLTFSVTTPNGNPGAAGFNIRTSQPGVFAVGGANSASTQATAGTSEATHTGAKQGEPAIFTVLWTPNAGSAGTVTFTAWGNAVNQSGDNSGDMAATTTLDVTVAGTCTPTTFYGDADGDGYGAAGTGTASACTAPPNFVANNTDCNDGNAAVHPGALETCNLVDDNCNGTVDEGVKTTFYADADGDGYGAAGVTVNACAVPTGYVANATDCNDASAAVHPGAPETCNGIDDNCDGAVDEGVKTTFYRDADGDGYGAAGVTVNACAVPAGYVANATDCNDASAAIHPGVVEVCNGVDDNCSGSADEGLAVSTYYRDADGDTYGAAAVTTTSCSMPTGYVVDHTDCDDTNPNIHPGAPEICGNLKDDNCNGTVDTDAPAATIFYRDADGDGYGATAGGTMTACAPPTGYVSSNSDCNDGDATIHPGATEACNGKDDNCSGAADEGFGTVTCGTGACSTSVPACLAGVPQVCAPVCPDAGSGQPDAGAAEAAGQSDGGAGDHPTGGADGATGDGGGAGGAAGAGEAGAGDARPADAGAGDAAAEAGKSPADAGGETGTIDVGVPGKSSGCGCALSQTGPGGTLALLVAALGLAQAGLRRRRRRR